MCGIRNFAVDPAPALPTTHRPIARPRRRDWRVSSFSPIYTNGMFPLYFLVLYFFVSVLPFVSMSVEGRSFNDYDIVDLLANWTCLSWSLSWLCIVPMGPAPWITLVTPNIREHQVETETGIKSTKCCMAVWSPRPSFWRIFKADRERIFYSRMLVSGGRGSIGWVCRC